MSRLEQNPGPLFSPSSMFWRINREIASGLAGPRAVLLQIAHPLIAAGVSEHSSFKEHRFARLYRTSMAAAALTFGKRKLAMRVIDVINKKHRQVHGRLTAPAGVFPAGTPYDANNPELKLWVLATIIDSTLLVYEMFVTPLSNAQRAEYYKDSLLVAKLFEIPEDLIPPTYEDFRIYMQRMMGSGVITVSETAQEIARELFSPSVEGRLLFLGSAVGIALLPERTRAEFGFKGSRRRERWLFRFAGVSRRVRAYIPSVLCSSPFATWSHLRALVMS